MWGLGVGQLLVFRLAVLERVEQASHCGVVCYAGISKVDTTCVGEYVMARDDFSANVKQHLGLRVNHRCSNPNCRATTSGPQCRPEASVNIGVAAHITAASIGGPRFNAALRTEERASAQNGIWLCQSCAKLVDNDEARFSEDLLRAWKQVAEAEALDQIGKPPVLPSAVTDRHAGFTELRWESNPRFGFSFLYPAYWDRQDLTNGDGNTYRHPRDSRIEVRAWGGYAVVSEDLLGWVEQTLESLATESGFTLVSRVPSGRHLVDFTETPDGVIESRQQVEGWRIVYSTDVEGENFTAMQTFVQYGDTQVGVLCRAPTVCYPDHEELFLRISHAVRILGATSAPFARTRSQPKPDLVGGERVPFSVDEISELGGLTLEGYRIYQGLILNSYSNGIDGSILILIDERLDGLAGEIRKDAYSDIETLRVELDPRTWSLKQADVKQALLLVVDEHFRTLYSEQLGRESARLDRVYLYQDRSKPTFVLTRDYSIGAGSYNGPVSYFLEVSARGIRYILPHALMSSLKTAWAIIGKENPVEIVSKKCRPDFDGSTPSEMAFQIIYERFYFEDDSWKSVLRRESGFWEYEGILGPEEFQPQFRANEDTR